MSYGVGQLTVVAHLKDLAVFCAAYMKHVGEVWWIMVDRMRKSAVSATQMRQCSPPSCHVPRSSGRRLRIDRPSLACWFRRAFLLLVPADYHPKYELFYSATPLTSQLK